MYENGYNTVISIREQGSPFRHWPLVRLSMEPVLQVTFYEEDIKLFCL
jgi:hypothetical protein